MNVPSEIPKKMRIKFKKCLHALPQDTPNGTTEFCTINTTAVPGHLADPGALLDAGAYPKLAAMLLWYDNHRPYKVWVSIEAFTSDNGKLELFTYWSKDLTIRHVSTDTKAHLCDIPRIKFKKFKDQTFAASIRSQRMYVPLMVRDMFPKYDADNTELQSLLTGVPDKTPNFHFGVVRTDGGVLENEIVRFRLTVGCHTICYRRDEMINPTS